MLSTSTVRSIIAVTVVGVFMLITACMALFPLFSKIQVDLGQYADFFAKTASVYTGIVGVVIGYYFGRKTSEPDDRAEAFPGPKSPTDA